MTFREDAAWSAGVIDGEGSFFVSRYSRAVGTKTYRYLYPHLQVAQSSNDGVPMMLTRMQEVLGGRVQRHHKARRPIREYQLSIFGFEKVQAALAIVWPWLGEVKRLQACMTLGLTRQPIKKGETIE